ncbi:MAG: metallophosphoesterase [Kiritimatiellia bacterium]
MKIIHFGDLHVWRHQLVWRELTHPKRWLGPANLLLRRARRFPPAYRQAALNEILRQKPDVAVFTGDFSSFSLPEEFREAAGLFAPIRESLGERLFALPGNHDCYTPRAVRDRLLQKHLPWVHTDPLSRLDLSDDLTLLGVHHSIPYRVHSNGQVSPESLTRLREELDSARTEHRTVLLAGHFPYVSPPEYPESADHRLKGEGPFIDLIREAAPALYLHGHQHIRWAIRPACTPDTVCLNCGSVAMRHPDPNKQAGFLSWTQQPDGSLQNLTAHTYDGEREWEERSMEIIEIERPTSNAEGKNRA